MRKTNHEWYLFMILFIQVKFGLHKLNGTNLETKKNISSNDAVLCCNFGD